MSSLQISDEDPVLPAPWSDIQMDLLLLEAISILPAACSEAPLGLVPLAAMKLNRSSQVPTEPLRRVYAYGRSCLWKCR